MASACAGGAEVRGYTTGTQRGARRRHPPQGRLPTDRHDERKQMRNAPPLLRFPRLRSPSLPPSPRHTNPGPPGRRGDCFRPSHLLATRPHLTPLPRAKSSSPFQKAPLPQKGICARDLHSPRRNAPFANAAGLPAILHQPEQVRRPVSPARTSGLHGGRTRGAPAPSPHAEHPSAAGPSAPAPRPRRARAALHRPARAIARRLSSQPLTAAPNLPPRAASRRSTEDVKASDRSPVG